MSENNGDPNEIIIEFLDGLPPAASSAVYNQIAFVLLFLLDDEEREQLLEDASAVGETRLKKLLTATGLSLIGGTVSVIALLDFVLERLSRAVPHPELEQEITNKFGNQELRRRFIREAESKWSQLRRDTLSSDAVHDFSGRVTAYREPEFPPLTGTTNNPQTLVELPIPTELVTELEKDFQQGPIVDDQGRRFLIEEKVDRIGALAVVIQALEHPPPHFHVRYQNQNASFAITDCARLRGVIGLEQFERNIKNWWKKNLCVLVETWNRTRPTDCPVGPMIVPEECKENAS